MILIGWQTRFLFSCIPSRQFQVAGANKSCFTETSPHLVKWLYCEWQSVYVFFSIRIRSYCFFPIFCEVTEIPTVLLAKMRLSGKIEDKNIKLRRVSGQQNKWMEVAMGNVYAGVDLGGTTAKLGLFRSDASLIRKWEIPTRKEDGGKYVIPDIAASIRKNLEEEGIDFSDLSGAGIGVPGPIRPDGYVEICVNIGMRDMNPVKELSDLLGGIPVKGGNDANVAALGEVWQGGGKGYKDVVAVTLGTGVGGGVILNGQIVAGSKGMGGEIGHMVMDWDWDEPDACNCGNYGCLEQIASATGIARHARKFMEKSDKPSVLRNLERVTAKDVFDAAKAGDELAEEVADHCMMYLARAMSYISQVVDPEVFVIGGGVSKAGQYLLDLIKKYYDPMITLTKEKAKLALATLGNDAGIYGAAKMVID